MKGNVYTCGPLGRPALVPLAQVTLSEAKNEMPSVKHSAGRQAVISEGVTPVSKKDGTCPECSEASGEPNVFCSKDTDCPGNMRCCSCGCGRKCMLPVEANPGYCPKFNSSEITICLANCTTDEECGSGEKCCSRGCLLTCMPAQPAHPGKCPRKEVLPSRARCRNSCSDDRECDSSQKCCFSGCGLKCMDPETDICKFPVEKGPCKAYMPMFYYSSKTKTCEMFIYGGCRGNENRFPTLEMCLSTCKYRDVCKLPMDPGGCDSHKITYYYNYTSKTCEGFTYKGCKGNENRFRTIEQCRSTCFYPEICKLPADPGPCRAYMPMYYYNHHNKSCTLFVYGGCEGNANRFPTLQQCEQHCWHPDICVLPPETGPCHDYSGQYYYSPAEKKCLPFPYGGCDGNANRFPTIEECMETCSRKDVCTLPPESGPCLGYFPHYYYNPANKSCERFIYGGCGGNGNRFETQKKCIWQCRNPDICKLPPETGPCAAAMLRYYYNSATKTCETFSYGGCEGNDNRFNTQKECEHACKKPAICRLPMNPGEGDHAIPMYYYDPVGTVCEEFTYKGHKGNPNRFATLVECQESCRDPDICNLPSKPGPCEAHIPRFYYNSTTSKCANFHYGGCRPNPNNFLTEEDCQLTCKGPEKPGSCPPGDPPNCLVTCQKDCDCSRDQKCCSDDCGQVCKDPVKGPLPPGGLLIVPPREVRALGRQTFFGERQGPRPSVDFESQSLSLSRPPLPDHLFRVSTLSPRNSAPLLLSSLRPLLVPPATPPLAPPPPSSPPVSPPGPH
ncbi:papilin-like [Sceloporus undulatus]|uniref:papilin-like n=1 Tax=Sceloporus undulatus TaxID=8520 RepID=UPI001C4A83C4|nr:papilin-like [Sceloporus undulatus]